MISSLPVRLGIIGCGRVLFGPYRSELENLVADGRVVVAVAADVRPEVEPAVRATFGASRFSLDSRAVFESADVDVAMILTPPLDHSALAITALQTGKHVVVEKPLATTLQAAFAVVAEAERQRRHLLCAPFVALSPTYLLMQRLLDEGRIGNVLSARSICGTPGPDWSQWFYTGEGGGPLLDLGVYNLTSLTGLVGPVQRVAALGDIAVSERRVAGELISPTIPDNFQVALDFGDGVLAVMSTGFTMQRLRSPALELFGSAGTLQLLGADWSPQGCELWENSVGAWTLFEETDPQWNYAAGLRHLVECLEDDLTPAVPARQALHVLEVSLLAQFAARDGRTRVVTTTFGKVRTDLEATSF